MGGVFSHKVGDRSAQVYGQSPFEEDINNPPTARVVQAGSTGHAYESALPVPTASQRVEQGNTILQAQVTQPVLATTWVTRRTTANSQNATPPAAIYGTGGLDDSNKQMQKAVCFFVVVGVIFGSIFYLNNAAFFNSTEDPEKGRNNTIVCPVTFDGNSTNTILTSCENDGCGGSIEWCSLDDSKRYILRVAVRGDYGKFRQTIRFYLNEDYFGRFRPITGQCRSFFTDVLLRTVRSSSGILKLEYDNAPEVQSTCDGKASRLRIILTEI